MPLKIAHRGYCNNHTSNTINSIKDAICNDFDMIEIDIQLDKNDNIIVYHDTYYKNKPIDTYSYNELKKDIPDLLLFSDIFKSVDYKNVKFYLDLKGSDNIAYRLHTFFVQLNIDTKNIWIGSFNINHIEILNTRNRYYKLGLITDNNYTIDILSTIVKSYDLEFVSFEWTMLNNNSIQYLKNKHIMVFIYTIKNIDTLMFIKHYNIDGIVSDVLI
jgi:glycerophosphoryl diester phosphodiesterase